MTHLFLILAAIILAAGILGGYSLAQRQPDPDDPHTASLTDVSSAPVPEPRRPWWLYRRFVARHPDHPLRRLDAALTEMRETARKRASTK